MGYAAVKALIDGKTRKMVGLRGNEMVFTDLKEALTDHEFKLEDDLLEMATILS